DRLEVLPDKLQTSSAQGDEGANHPKGEPNGWKREAVVERIEPASPAAKAGIQSGDVVVQVGDVRVTCGLDVERALVDRATGEAVPVVLRRGDGEQRVELVLQPLDRAGALAGDVTWRKLGLRLLPVSAEAVGRNNSQLHGGLAVVDVRPDSAA